MSQRPPFSYASLVAQALHSREKATLKEICLWISTSYPDSYKMEDLTWQVNKTLCSSPPANLKWNDGG